MNRTHTTSRRSIALILASSAMIAAPAAQAQDEAPEITYEEKAVVQPLPGVANSTSDEIIEISIPPADTAGDVPVVVPIVPPVESVEQPVELMDYEIERREIRQSPPVVLEHAVPTGKEIKRLSDRELDYPNDYPVHRDMYAGREVDAPIYFPEDGYPAGAMPYPAQFRHDQIGRDEWLEECRARYDGGYEHGRNSGRNVGALLGAAAGGVIGNRVAGRGNRLGGTLVGAGVGGLAGAAAGSAIGDSSDRRHGRLDECEAFLVQYERSGHHAGYRRGPVMLVPIMVPVQQRAVVREYVTEEWVDEEVMVTVPGETIRRSPARAPSKMVPIKQVPVKSKSVKSIK